MSRWRYGKEVATASPTFATAASKPVISTTPIALVA
jgi:hypothetical protein